MKTFILLFALAAVSISAQELKLPALSPTQTVTQDFATSTIEITYSRPSMRGRTIFGGLVPYGEVWRTGANQATKITFGEDVIINNTTVPKGSYSFYTVPNKNSWTVILNKNTGNWGAFGYDKADDVVRFSVTPISIPQTVETFTMLISNIETASCSIDLMWENTAITVPVRVENNDKIVADIEKAIEKPNIPYRSAALYYVQTNQKLDKALEYATKAVEANDKAYWNHLLVAEIAVKLNKKDVAKKHALRARELSKGTPAENAYQESTQAVLDAVN